jgi:hypothetical protein
LIVNFEFHVNINIHSITFILKVDDNRSLRKVFSKEGDKREQGVNMLEVGLGVVKFTLSR